MVVKRLVLETVPADWNWLDWAIWWVLRLISRERTTKKYGTVLPNETNPLRPCLPHILPFLRMPHLRTWKISLVVFLPMHSRRITPISSTNEYTLYSLAPLCCLASHPTRIWVDFLLLQTPICLHFLCDFIFMKNGPSLHTSRPTLLTWFSSSNKISSLIFGQSIETIRATF